MSGDRATCAVQGCTNLREVRRMANGVPRYRTRCAKHRRRRGYANRLPPAEVCPRCGWRGKVHRHRIDPKGPYTEANTVLVCPNGHAHLHGRGDPCDNLGHPPDWRKEADDADENATPEAE